MSPSGGYEGCKSAAIVSWFVSGRGRRQALASSRASSANSGPGACCGRARREAGRAGGDQHSTRREAASRRSPARSGSPERRSRAASPRSPSASGTRSGELRAGALDVPTLHRLPPGRRRRACSTFVTWIPSRSAGKALPRSRVSFVSGVPSRRRGMDRDRLGDIVLNFGPRGHDGQGFGCETCAKGRAISAATMK